VDGGSLVAALCGCGNGFVFGCQTGTAMDLLRGDIVGRRGIELGSEGLLDVEEEPFAPTLPMRRTAISPSA